ncbi:MAG: lysophospholipid acyltransferase family protein [Bacteroidales bacterium]|nr:lysophospholipid acyltransferase family protein [Bacteroidales bacterium]
MKRIGFLFVRLWALGLSITPFHLLYLRSDFYFFVVYHVVRYRRKVVRNNLLNSFPEMGILEIKAVEKQFYHHLIDTVVETCRLMRMSVEDVKKHIDVVNPEVVEALFAHHRSFFYAFPHSGNWEWFGKRMQTLSGHHPMAIYKKVKNPEADRFIYDLRTSLPVEMIESDAALRTLARREGKLDAVLILADQTSFGLESDYWNVFMHQETCWFTGLERMARFLDYAIVFVDMKRVRRGQYELTFHLLTDDPKSTAKGEIMERYSQHIERFIHEQPYNWLWSHRRWKHKRKHDLQ